MAEGTLTARARKARGLVHDESMSRLELQGDTFEALDALRPQVRRFVLLYATRGSPWEGDSHGAYVEAGLGEPKSKASAMLRGVRARRAILLVERDTRDLELQNAPIGAAWLLHELAAMNEVTILDCFDFTEDGRAVQRLDRLTKEQAKAIDSIKIETVVEGSSGVDEITGEPLGEQIRKVEVRMVGRTKVLEMIGKHVDVQGFLERREVDAGQNLIELMREGRERARRRMLDGAEEPIEVEGEVVG